MAAGTVAENTIDTVADIAETVSEESEQIAEATRLLSSRDAGLILSGLGVGVVLGFAGGYFLLRNRLHTKYQELADKEIAGMREHYDRKLVALESREEKGIVKNELESKVTELDYKPDPRRPEGPVPYHKIGEQPDPEPEEVPEPETRNVFEDQTGPEGDGILELNSGWDYAKEVKSRNPHIPYVIHRDEHKEGPAGEKEYERIHLTYFEGDDVLSDERDQVIEARDEVVGIDNLTKFGHGSGDSDIVYIRNDQMEIDIEVVRSTGKYATEVHGFQDSDLQHSSMRRRAPRRSEYDDMER